MSGDRRRYPVSIQESLQKFGGPLPREGIEEVQLPSVSYIKRPQSPARRGVEEYRKEEKSREEKSSFTEQEPFERTTVKG